MKNIEKQNSRALRGQIKFEGLFDESLRKRAEDFLESGRPVASLTKGLLIIAVIGGTLAVGAVAPNLFKVLGVDDKRRSQRLSQQNFRKLQRSFYELRRKKLLESATITNGGVQWRFTEKGKALVWGMLGKGWSLPLPPKWDRKWRLVFFDIPTKKTAARDALRRELEAMGCYQFQKSVWIYPFPCAKEVLDTATFLGVKPCIEVCTIEDFSNPRVLSFFKPLLEEYVT